MLDSAGSGMLATAPRVRMVFTYSNNNNNSNKNNNSNDIIYTLDPKAKLRSVVFTVHAIQ